MDRHSIHKAPSRTDDLVVLDTFLRLRYDLAMLFNLPEIVSDQELEAILATSLRTGGGGVSRMTELEMARVIAVHLVNGLAVAGVRAVRVPQRPSLKD